MLQSVQVVMKVNFSSVSFGYERGRFCSIEFIGSRCFCSINWCFSSHSIPLINLGTPVHIMRGRVTVDFEVSTSCKNPPRCLARSCKTMYFSRRHLPRSLQEPLSSFKFLSKFLMSPTKLCQELPWTLREFSSQKTSVKRLTFPTAW